MKKLLAILIALVMMLGCLNITAFAGAVYIPEVNFTLGDYIDEETPIKINIPDGAHYGADFYAFVYLCGENTYLCVTVPTGHMWVDYSDGEQILEKMPDLSSCTKILASLRFYTTDDECFGENDTAMTVKCGDDVLNCVEDLDFSKNYWLPSGPTGFMVGVDVTPKSYTITNAFPKSEKDKNGGYITIDKTAAKKGEKVIVNVYPNEGYKLASPCFFKGEGDKNPTGISLNENYEGYFEMPAKDITVSTIFEKVKTNDPKEKSPQTGDTSNTALWVMLFALSSMGLCACLVLGKKRKNEQ